MKLMYFDKRIHMYMVIGKVRIGGICRVCGSTRMIHAHPAYPWTSWWPPLDRSTNWCDCCAGPLVAQCISTVVYGVRVWVCSMTCKVWLIRIWR